jgi:hypothetical protein
MRTLIRGRLLTIKTDEIDKAVARDGQSLPHQNFPESFPIRGELCQRRFAKNAESEVMPLAIRPPQKEPQYLVASLKL